MRASLKVLHTGTLNGPEFAVCELKFSQSSVAPLLLCLSSVLHPTVWAAAWPSGWSCWVWTKVTAACLELWPLYSIPPPQCVSLRRLWAAQPVNQQAIRLRSKQAAHQFVLALFLVGNNFKCWQIFDKSCVKENKENPKEQTKYIFKEPIFFRQSLIRSSKEAFTCSAVCCCCCCCLLHTIHLVFQIQNLQYERNSRWSQ